MSSQARSHTLWQVLPFIGLFIAEWQIWQQEKALSCYSLTQVPQELLPYPIDMSPLLALPFGTLDAVGVPYNRATEMQSATYHPTSIAQYALTQWNVYLETREEKHKQAFMTQAHWLVEHESRLTNETSGWPMPFPVADFYASGPWLSALTQGNVISVLVRAYRLTDEKVFLEVAQRAIRTFELDIVDGGVSASVDGNGIFFEEVAVYPAAHILNGYILALFGLYDYVALTGEDQIAALIERSLATLHTLIDSFDTGYWSRYDLLNKSLVPLFYHALHVTLLEALARYSGCEHCTMLAARWAGYLHSFRYRLCYFIVSRTLRYWHRFQEIGFRAAFLRLLRSERRTGPKSVYASITPPVVQHGSLDREVN